MRNILALALSALLATPLLAQQNASLRKAADTRTAAMVAGDSKAWAKYTTDDFTVTGVEGVVKTKQDRIAEIEGRPLTGTRTPPTDEKWRSYGNTVVYSGQLTGANGEKQRITTVWVKQGATWKVAAVQLTTIAAAPSP